MHHRKRLGLTCALPFLAFSLLAPLCSPAAAQNFGSPACQVTRFRLDFTTGGDDLRGGQNNLNIEIHYVGGRVENFLNVNRSANWGNNSRHMVELDLRPPTAANQISYIRLIHLAQGGLVVNPGSLALGPEAGVKTQDNWDMTRVVVSAQGMGGIVGEAGPYRFTGENIFLSVNLKFPASACSKINPSATLARAPAANMTNQDVLRMASAGVPESAIVAAIKRSRPHFDFSPAAQRELTHAGVSPALLRAMHEQGGGDLNPQPYPPQGSRYLQQPVSPVAGALNPQPLPPKNRGGARTPLTSRNFVLPPGAHVIAGPEVKNPIALSAIQMRPVRSIGPGPIGMGETMSAQLPGRSPRPGARAAARFDRGLNRGIAPAASLCTGPPRITSVEANHSAAGVQFTPDGATAYNITGCGFGAAPGRVVLTGSFTAHGGQIALVPYHAYGTPSSAGWGTNWSDGHIEAMVDPSVRGEMDLASVALVVTPASGAPVYGAHFPFRARRGSPIMLASLPQTAFCDYFAPSDKGNCSFPGSVSLGGGFNSPCHNWGLNNCTVEVLRSGFQANPGVGFNDSGKMFPDLFTIELKPGFVIYSVAMQVVGLNEKVDRVVSAPIIRGKVIEVQPPIYPTGGGYNFSLYGLRIMVVGPDGVTNPGVGQ